MGDKSRRQQPGFACEECRRRKARCDRVRPKCGLCMETGMACIVIEKKPQRGLKKGELNAMRSQIANLQRQLNQQLGYETDHAPGISGQITPERDHDVGQSPHAIEVDSRDMELSDLHESNIDLSMIGISSASVSLGMAPTATSAVSGTAALNLGWPDWASDWRPDWRPEDLVQAGQKFHMGLPDMEVADQRTLHTSEALMPLSDPRENAITDHMRADLDQVFFDRVYPVLPIIYRRRFFSWADQENPGEARACLRSAMRTMAAAMSAPSSHLCDQLYAETCQLLHSHIVDTKDKIVIEYIQAWLILGHYELLRLGDHQAMLTAGRCFRLVLMARLSDIDAPSSEDINLQQISPVSMIDEDVFGDSFSAVEERRRTFWLAYCFDRLLCSRNEYPLTLQEEMICARLPASESNFQENRHIRMDFLPEAMSASQNVPALSPFAECIILVTIHGRCMAHRRSYRTKESCGGTAEGGDFWTRQQQLATVIERRMQILGNTSSVHVDSDPLLFFAHMLARSTVIKLGHMAQKASSTWRNIAQQDAPAAYEHRAAIAAGEMVRLAKQLPSFRCFRAHPFLADPLACATSFLTSRGGNVHLTGDNGIQHLLKLLRDMQVMNSLARGYFL